LAIHTYTTLSNCTDPVFREQTTCASLAFPANVAEEYDLDSSGQLYEYLNRALGCCARLRTQLYLTGTLGIIEDRTSVALIEESLELSELLCGLIERFS